MAIARTLLKNPPILLLDEATRYVIAVIPCVSADEWSNSALDTSTEKDIQKALQNLVKGRSSVSIAHRLSVRRIAKSTCIFADNRRRQLFLLICKTFFIHI